VRSRKRYRELFRRYGIPNAINVGHGIFGRTGTMFIDNDDGRIIAYAPSVTSQMRWMVCPGLASAGIASEASISPAFSTLTLLG
jgi:hypothetical protein